MNHANLTYASHVKPIISTQKITIFLLLLTIQSVVFSKDLGVIQPVLILGGTQGNMLEQFNEPDAVAFMSDGRLLAGDTINGRFKIYTFTENSLAIVTVGTPGTGDCQFDNSLEVILPNGRKIYNEVQGIACNSKDEIFVVDQGNRRIQVFDADGTCLKERTIDLEPVLVPPDPEDGTTYTSIQGLTIDDDDSIYLTDTGTRRIYKFRKNGSSDPDFRFQVKEKNEYILADPESMVIQGDQLFVADEGHHLIKIYHRVTGRFTGKVVGHPDIFGRDVEGLAISQDLLFAISEEFGQVLIFDLKKAQIPLVGQFGEKGLTPGRFLSADGMAISQDGKHLVVADQGNFRLQVFLLQDILATLN